MSEEPPTFDPYRSPFGWDLAIVHTCGPRGKKVRLDTVHVKHGLASVRGAGMVSGDKIPNGVFDAEKLEAFLAVVDKLPPPFASPDEETPDGRSKPRWTCPLRTCRLDVSPSWPLLSKVSVELYEAGVSEIELAVLAAILSK